MKVYSQIVRLYLDISFENNKLFDDNVVTRSPGSPSNSNNTMSPSNISGSSGKELCKNKNAPQFTPRNLHHTRLHALDNL